MRLLMRQFGMSLGTREIGRNAKAIVDELLENHSEKVIFDFADVSVVTNSFADEVFGKLIIEIGFDEFKSMTSFVNINRYAAICIKKAIENRLSAISV